MTGAQPKPAARLTAISPEFIVPDVVAAAEYYRDVLGFQILGYFADPPVYAMVGRDVAVIHFGKADGTVAPSPNLARRSLGIDAYIWVNDLHALNVELRERGAKIIEGPVQRIYNCLELVVDDLYGFRLVFSMDRPHPNA